MAVISDSSATWSQIEVLPGASGTSAETWLQVSVRVIPPTAVVPNPDPQVNIVNFDGADSEGGKFRWSHTSVPGGSAVANETTAFPDSGATTPLDMTDNEALYHTDAITGGTTFDDTSGNSNDMTISGITLGTGKVGAGSAVFTGTTSSLLIDAPVDASGDWTIAFWFKNLKGNTKYRAGAVNTALDQYPILIDTGTDNLGIWASGAFQDSGADMIPANYTGWHHILAVGNTVADTTSFWVDGLPVGTAAGKTNDVIKWIASSGNTDQVFADEVTEIAVWQRALTSNEAWNAYTLQSGDFAGGASGLAKTFAFAADVAGNYGVEITSAYGSNTATDTATAAATIGGGYTAYGGAGLLYGPALAGGGIDHFAGGGLLTYPLLGKK